MNMDILTNSENILYGAIAIVVFCVLYITQAVVAKYRGEAFIEKLQIYKPYAIMAAKWVEQQIPDDYGKSDDTPIYARGAHKLNVFLIKFNELVERSTGKPANRMLIEEATKWSTELAKEVSKK